MTEVASTKEHHWVVLGTAGVGGAICVLMVNLPTHYDALPLQLCSERILPATHTSGYRHTIILRILKPWFNRSLEGL